MTARIKDSTFWILCTFLWAAFALAAQASVHVIELQSHQQKLVTLSQANAQFSLILETENQRFEMASPALYNTPQYFVLKSTSRPKTYTFTVDNTYSESAELHYDFSVIDIAGLDSLPEHDAASLSGLHVEERAKLYTSIHCLENSLQEKLKNQISLSALEALWKLERYNDLIAALEDTCVDNNTTNLPTALAKSYLAQSYLEQSNFQSAIGHFEAVQTWYIEQNGSAYYARAMQDVSVQLGLSAVILGHITQSNELYESGRDALEKAHKYFINNGFEISTIYSLANLWTVFAMDKDFRQAFSALSLSNQTIDKLAPDLLSQKIANLNHQSITYTSMGNTSAAIDAMREAINLGPQEELQHLLSSVYFNLGSLYLQIGDYDLSEKYYLSVKPYFEQHHAEDAKGDVNDGLAVVAIKTGRFDDAEKYLKEALRFYKKNANRTATMNMRLGYVATLKGDYDIAKEFFLEAGKYFESEIINRRNLSYYIRLAQFFSQQHKVSETQDILLKIEAYYDHLPDVDGMPVGFKPIQLAQQLYYLDLKVDLFRLQGDVLQQREHLEQLNQIIRAVSAGLDTARAGPVWADYTSRIVTRYNETLYQAYGKSGDDTWLGDLFTALETHTAFSARRQRVMAHNTAEQNTHAQKGENNFLQNLYLSQVEQAEQALFNAQEASQRMAAQLALNEARERFRLSSASIDIAEFELPSVPTLAQTQNMLKPNEVVLRFFELGDAMYRFVIASDFWRVEEAGLTSKHVRRLVSQLEPDKLNIRDKQLQELAVLIPADIVANDNFDKLIIVNSGPNHYVPYAALNMATQATGYQPLMQRFSLVLPFHLGAYLLNDNPTDDNGTDPKEREVIDPSITIFADPVFNFEAKTSVTEEIESNETKRSWLRNIKPLPATKQEARSIGKILEKWEINPLLNKQATHHALLSQKSRSSTILHIASHGYFNEQTPDVIGVATSALDSNDQPLPGFLSLRSMLAVPFTSKLIVVSGCETGMGRELKGEGLVSLARGLIGQGAGGVISTLWEIPDRPTALFMRYFYEALLLKKGDVPAALAHAQSELMATGRYKSPRYWAGFTYTGGSRGDSVIAM